MLGKPPLRPFHAQGGYQPDLSELDVVGGCCVHVGCSLGVLMLLQLRRTLLLAALDEVCQSCSEVVSSDSLFNRSSSNIAWSSIMPWRRCRAMVIHQRILRCMYMERARSRARRSSVFRLHSSVWSSHGGQSQSLRCASNSTSNRRDARSSWRIVDLFVVPLRVFLFFFWPLLGLHVSTLPTTCCCVATASLLLRGCGRFFR